MKRPLSDWSAIQLAEAFDLYNVTHLLTWSEEAEKALSAYPDLIQKIESPEPFSGWEVLRSNNWFLKGEGRLSNLSYDRLEFADVLAPQGLAVVSFHWAPTLIAEGAELTPVDVPNDPVPFIGLKNPEAQVVITNGSAW